MHTDNMHTLARVRNMSDSVKAVWLALEADIKNRREANASEIRSDSRAQHSAGLAILQHDT